MARLLLVVTAAAEAGAGLCLLWSPTVVTGLLLGTSLEAPAVFMLGRIAGAALLSVGLVCWLARTGGPSPAVRGLILALLLYNCAAGAILAHTATGVSLAGIVMWTAIAFHAVLAVWCLACLRRTRPG
jgi:hypothetical protein